MVATTESLSRKLESGEQLHSVVSTMKGLASVSIHEYEEAVSALRTYRRTVDLGFRVLFRAVPDSVPDESRGNGRTAVIVIGTDQGLCGPLNRDIVEHALEWLRREGEPPGEGPGEASGPEDPGPQWAGPDIATTPFVVAVGARVERDLDLAGFTVDERVALPGSVESISPAVQDLVLRIDRWRSEEGVGRVVAFHHEPIRRTEHRPQAKVIVPPDLARLRRLSRQEWPTNMIPATPTEPREVLRSLTREALFASLFRSFAEARASEHGARLSAMQSAEQNIEERIEKLRNQYHQVRQAEITAELLDVVSGFEALEGGR